MELNEALDKLPDKCPNCGSAEFKIRGNLIEGFEATYVIEDGEAEEKHWENTGDTYGQDPVEEVHIIECADCGETIWES